MSDPTTYFVFDFSRDAVVHEFDAFSDFSAMEEFDEWYNLLIGAGRWEKRTLGRYWLFARQFSDTGELAEPRHVSLDEDVRLDEEYFFLSSAPASDAEWEACEAEFRRLDDLDMVRIQERGNARADAFNGKRSSS